LAQRLASKRLDDVVRQPIAPSLQKRDDITARPGG
jgi:hypothetical protein